MSSKSHQELRKTKHNKRGAKFYQEVKKKLICMKALQSYIKAKFVCSTCQFTGIYWVHLNGIKKN